MENYAYLDKEELTSYDRYILNKRNGLEKAPSFSTVRSQNVVQKQQQVPFEIRASRVEDISAKRKLDDYDKYLFEQLQRTEPSAERVLTKDEFYGSNVEKGQDKKNVFSKMFNNVTFKKGGKIILIFYVIIMIALASILIVANTTDTYGANFANATQDRASENIGVVGSMTIEEKDFEQDNWFDRLCDAINK